MAGFELAILREASAETGHTPTWDRTNIFRHQLGSLDIF